MPGLATGILLGALLCSCAHPTREDRMARNERMPGIPTLPFFVESRNFISAAPGKSRLDVYFRIPLNFFVFVRNQDAQAAAPFIARGEVNLEILDSTGRSVARDLLRREMGSHDEQTAAAPDRFLDAIFSFNLSPGEYAMVVEVNDLESSRKSRYGGLKAVAKDFWKNELAVSDIVFLPASAPNDTASITPVSFGGDVPPGRSAFGYAELVSSAPMDSIRFSFAVRGVRPGREPHLPAPADSFSTATVIRDRFLEPQKTEQGFVYRVSRLQRPRQYAVWFPINGDTLEEGNYDLKTVVSDGVSTVDRNLPFVVRWIDKPRSLRNMHRAIEALQYIASEAELDELRSASAERQRVLFEEFWKKRAKAARPGLNPEMAEYYRRVDYATENFGTLRDPDGMKTDRGKAYILYGPPAKVERLLTPGADPREIWSYPNLRKRLIFVDASRRGEYKLLETQSEDK